jgi:hypothetical protein
MYGSEPWPSDIGPHRRRLFGMPLLLVAAIALAWLFINGPLAFELGRFFLEDDGNATLELPEELVLARLPWTFGWCADPTADGVLLALPDDGNPDAKKGTVPLSSRGQSPFSHPWQVDAIEHWTRPWKEGKREPIPAAWRVATEPDWQNDTAMVCHFGFNSPVTRDRGLLAAMYHPAQQAAQTRIIALPAGQEIARVEAFPPGCNGKGLAWHPTENVLVIAGYGTVTLASGPDWKLRKLATAERDFREWERRASAGQEESGYYPNENPNQLLFSDDGTLLIIAMDRGLRVYDWKEVRAATGQLPAPRHAVDGVLVPHPLASFKMTFSVAYDARHRLVLWSENDGKLKFLNLSTSERGTLLALTNRYSISRLHLCATGDALVAEIVRFGTSGNGPFVLAVLDYGKLLERGGVEPARAADGR